ncbi:LptA/OstA family protein [Neokomagataea anthophila]|nr:LptA/OstA family protein [Neokomagataea anthophila]
MMRPFQTHLLSALTALLCTAAPLCISTAHATAGEQDLSHGQTVKLFWKGEEVYDRNSQTVTLSGGARAIRGDVTVDADTLIGYLRKKNQPTQDPQQKSDSSDPMSGSLELYRLEARGHVHVYNQADQAWGDRGMYDMDQAVMLLTGHALRLTTPQDILTARDVMEYHARDHMSVGRGNATVTTNDGKQVQADVLAAYTAPQSTTPTTPAPQSANTNTTNGPLGGGSSKLDRAYGWGHVIIRTQNQTATGDRGVYVADSQIARLIGHVHVTQGQNQNNGSQAIVNMKTGIATMLPGSDSPIQGLVVPNEAAPSQPHK